MSSQDLAEQIESERETKPESGATLDAQDVNGRARRIYNYWRMIMNENRGDDIPLFCEALRLVVLVQASSAFVERGSSLS